VAALVGSDTRARISRAALVGREAGTRYPVGPDQKKELKARKKRIENIADGVSTAEAVKDVVAGIQVAITVAITASTVAATSAST
jgi:hypothetical protein